MGAAVLFALIVTLISIRCRQKTHRESQSSYEHPTQYFPPDRPVADMYAHLEKKEHGYVTSSSRPTDYRLCCDCLHLLTGLPCSLCDRQHGRFPSFGSHHPNRPREASLPIFGDETGTVYPRCPIKTVV